MKLDNINETKFQIIIMPMWFLNETLCMDVCNQMNEIKFMNEK